jgi:hypothetical protein
VLTFSSSDLSAMEPGEPAPAYLATMARGLRHVHGLSDDEIADYLLDAGGVSADRVTLLAAIR